MPIIRRIIRTHHAPRPVIYRVRGKSVPGSVGLDPDGNLQIVGGDGADTLTGSLSGHKLHISLNGTMHNIATKGINSIVVNMFGGNDSVDLGNITIGASISGEAGNDAITGGAGNDTLVGGDGADVLGGGAGFDTADYSARRSAFHFPSTAKPTTARRTSTTTFATMSSIIGGSGDDRIVGNNLANFLEGQPELGFPGLAHDTLIGLGGNDTLYGDDCDGGLGNDTMSGAGPDQEVSIGTADYSSRTESMNVDLKKGKVDFPSGETDTLLNGVQVFLSGSGNDTIRAQLAPDFASATDQTIYGGAGNDVITGIRQKPNNEYPGESTARPATTSSAEPRRSSVARVPTRLARRASKNSCVPSFLIRTKPRTS